MSCRDQFSTLSREDLRVHSVGLLHIPRQYSRGSRSGLLDFILNNGSPQLLHILSKVDAQRQIEIQSTSASKKRKRADDQHEQRKLRKQTNSDYDTHDPTKFLELPTDADVKNCYREFYDHTSNIAFTVNVCGVSAREIYATDEQITTHVLTHIPNSHRLKPKKCHPEHDLYNGRLLEPSGVQIQGETIRVRSICQKCLNSLHSSTDKPPSLSLANKMWIGRVPCELRSLTFSEQMLIALLYPRVYVFKLYPKSAQYSTSHSSTLQRALRGTVSTYDLDIKGIASMITGNLMPRPVNIFASLISITIIGVGSLPKHWLQTMFRVRQQVIFDALRWLQTHNSKYYGNIDIDSDRLQILPEDDVPIEILGVVRKSTDAAIVTQENDGYVPSEDQ